MFFIFTRISWPKKGGGKQAKQVYQKHTNSASKKCWEKQRWEKGRKNVFYIHTNIVTKKRGEKNARHNFSRNTRIVRAKMLGKRSSGKRAKKRFLYSHEYRDPKKRGGGWKREKQVFQKDRNIACKKCSEKNFGIMGKTFFIFIRISWPKKGGKKRAKQFFRKSQIVHSKMLGIKLSENSAKKRFLYSHKYHYQKMRGKNARNNFSRNTRIVRAKNVGKKIVGKK